MDETTAEFAPYLEQLRRLPFVRAAALRAAPVQVRDHLRPDAVVGLDTPLGTRDFFVDLKKSHLTYTLVDGFLAKLEVVGRKPWILFAPYVGRGMARYLGERNVNYVDRAGNCSLQIGKTYRAHIEGRRPPRLPPQARGMGRPGYQVLFAILARPELLDAPIRTLAHAAGAGKTAAANTLARLREEGIVGAGRERRRLLRPNTILERWVTAYPTIVRPRLLVGRYRTPDPNPRELEERVATVLGPEAANWGWGGGAAAMRLLGTYRGEDTVLHVEGRPPELARLIRAIPAADGPLTVLGVPGIVAFEGQTPRTVHPLLVYTELVTSADPRAREVALELKDRYLKEWH